MTEIRIHHPVVTAHRVDFRWDVVPRSTLYSAGGCSLRFPDSVDLCRLDPGLFWIAQIAVLHAQWVFLRPCRVRLPVRLAPGAARVWERLVASYADTLEYYAHGTAGGGAVTIVEEGDPLPAARPVEDRGGCAAAFSGGKDSTCHAAMLSEFTRRPLLVTTTSPMAGKHDHLSARRRWVMAAIQARRDVEWVEVHSDFRAVIDNEFPRRAGFPVAMNEVADTSLYFASLLLAGAATGRTHLFLASEADVQESIEANGKVVQHPHFMYSNATQHAMDALLRPHGLRYGSLTGSIYGRNVQELLWRRYPELGELQYSCFRQERGEGVCSRCPSCFYHAMCLMALGHHPRRMGIDPVRLFPAMRDWTPRLEPVDDPRTRAGTKVYRRLAAYFMRTPRKPMLRIISDGRPVRRCSESVRDAMRAFLTLRRRMGEYGCADQPGYREGFVEDVDPLLRESVRALYRSTFPTEAPEAYGATLERSRRLARWLVEPLESVEAGAC